MSLWSYIQGKRYGEEAHQLEEDAMSDPFLQDAIDGYDRVNDRPFYYLRKIEKRLSKKQTERKLRSLQEWGIVAVILLLICVTVFFFVSDRVNILKDMNFFQNHTDDVVSNYTNNSLPNIKSSALVARQVPDSVSDNTIKDSIDRDDEEFGATEESADLSIEKNQPVAQQVQPLQQKEKKKSEENRESVKKGDAYEETDRYSLSTDEIRAMLSGDKKPAEIKKPANNPSRTRTQTQTQPQTQIQTQTQNPAQLQSPIPTPVKGNEAYNNYIEQNRRKLTDANRDNQHGKVILMFHVDNQGRPVDISILRSLGSAVDKEAISLLQNGPNWTAGDQLARLEITL